MGAEPRIGGPRSPATPTFTETAFAKVNLTLRILGKRPDGYHEIESLVVFAAVGDVVTLTPGDGLSLTVGGPLAHHAGPDSDNLVVRAAHALARGVPGITLGAFSLEKYVPAQAGLGGGSADAAAALRLLARANGLSVADDRLHVAARETGADVPVCLDPRPRWMRGIGEILSEPLNLPPLTAVLIRPNVALATRDVFAALKAPPLGRSADGPPPEIPAEPAGLLHFAASRSNDLERPSVSIAPQVAEALAALRAFPQCLLARMSGSGSACFGIFANPEAASNAARALAAAQPDWWVQETTIGAV